MADRPRVKITRLEVDTELLSRDQLTLGEAATVEKVLGVPFPRIEPDSAEAMIAFVWISARRHDMSLTLDDIRGVTFDELDLVMPEEGEAVDPSLPADPAGEADDGLATTSSPES